MTRPEVASGGPPGTRARWVPGAVMFAGGVMCAGVGLTMMAAWLVRATAVLRFGGGNVMAFNTALTLAVTGAALAVLAARRWPWTALAAGAFGVVVGVLQLAETMAGHSFGIDELIVRAYLRNGSQIPGQVAVNTAICLALAGLGLLAWAPWRARRRPSALAAAGSAIALIALLAVFGYATTSSVAYSWGRLTAMAFPTAGTLLVLALAMLAGAWRDTRPRPGGLPGWLPLPAGLVALGLAAGLWLAVVREQQGHGRIDAAAATIGATLLGVLMAALVAVAVWLAQRLDQRRRVAQSGAARRAAAEAAARESEHQLFQFLDAMPVGVFITARSGRPYFANQEARRLLGRGLSPATGPDELVTAYQVFLAGTGRPYPAARLPAARSLRGETTHAADAEVRRPDGTRVPLETWGRPVYGTGGDIAFSVTALTDISERQAAERELTRRAAEIQQLNASLEEQVRQRTRHLEAAIRDLESFSYSVAHDLRTPLRAMSGFAEALAEDYGDRLGEEGRGYAHRIEAASQHMAELIDDLLHLAQVSRAALQLADVDLSAEAAAICDRLRAREPGRDVRTVIQDGVHVTADRALIRSALGRLLDNAWKFTAGRPDALIEFGTAPAGDAAACCYVRDNGAGFDPAYAGKLFGPFQRLHTEAEFPGTGIGLASVRRIVERHGGRVWAEGAAGQGATFWFTLGAKEPA